MAVSCAPVWWKNSSSSLITLCTRLSSRISTVSNELLTSHHVIRMSRKITLSTQQPIEDFVRFVLDVSDLIEH